MRNCIYCDKQIRSGRSDKKFCDSGCKDAYYNLIKIKEYEEIKKVDNILKRNRRILKKLFNPKPEKAIPKNNLVKMGFEFDFHTHFLITKVKRNEFIFCYDYGYREVSEGQIQIIRSFN
jgi:hypothetical protein